MIAADGDLDRIEGKVLGFSLFSCTSISNITPHSENNTIHLAIGTAAGRSLGLR
jgi:hypothetical protein